MEAFQIQDAAVFELEQVEPLVAMPMSGKNSSSFESKVEKDIQKYGFLFFAY